jgi:uroporphyrinogen-III synthase
VKLRNASGVSCLQLYILYHPGHSFMPRVVLFKTKSEVNGSDAYSEAFAQAGFEVRYIPVLQEEFHIDELSQFISDEKTDWGGVVVTSKRGAEGCVQAAQRCNGAPSFTSKSLSYNHGEMSKTVGWNDIQLYTVGSTALDYLSEINPSLPKDLQLDTARAIQAKSASTLLPLILQSPPTDTRPLLLIRGDKSTNELQHGLKKAHRTYVETTVYSTSCRPSLQSDVRSLLDDIGKKEEETWLAFFSPSSAEMVLNHLPSPKESPTSGSWASIRTAAIGETTAQFLVENMGEVHAVAKEPTAGGLLSAIQASQEDPGK